MTVPLPLSLIDLLDRLYTHSLMSIVLTMRFKHQIEKPIFSGSRSTLLLT